MHTLRIHVALAAVLCLTACNSTPYEHHRDEQGLVGFTGPVELELPYATGSVTLDYEIRASKGSWQVELIQPSGEVLRAAESGAAKGKLVGPTGHGRWIGRIHFNGFSGGYRATLK
ncbi:MAG: hypothetical protein ACKO32_11870 [Planctomycetia bacterium]